MNYKLYGEVRECNTPQEMRAEIERLTYDDPLVRAVLFTSRKQGLSAEDTYTLLAYNALRFREKILDEYLKHCNLCGYVPSIAITKDQVFVGDKEDGK